MTEHEPVDNRRTLCDHCSLRTDLPGFIGGDHAQANINRIEKGDIFKCHLIHLPTEDDAPNRVCLGAALAAGVPLKTPPRKDEPAIYATLAEYKTAQEAGRKTNDWLMFSTDYWYDRNRSLWHGWWERAPAGNWHYLLTTLESNTNDSVYFFFDQVEDLFGPLERE